MQPLQPSLLDDDIPDMNPVWAEGSGVYHTRARCSRLKTIEKMNRRSQKSEPGGKTLCDICRRITQEGRKG